MNKQAKIGAAAITGAVLGFIFASGFIIPLAIGAACGVAAVFIFKEESEQSSDPASIEKDGYTKAAVGNKVTEVRAKLSTLRDYGAKIKENLGGDHGAEINRAVNDCCTQVNSMLSNLQEDPEDMQFVGLLLQSIDETEKVLVQIDKFARQNQTGPLVDKAYEGAKELLATVGDSAEKKRTGAMAVGDIAQTLGSINAAKAMAQHS